MFSCAFSCAFLGKKSFIFTEYFNLLNKVKEALSHINKEKDRNYAVFRFGGVGETRTLAPGFSRPTPLAGAPRHQLEYYSRLLYAIFKY